MDHFNFGDHLPPLGGHDQVTWNTNELYHNSGYSIVPGSLDLSDVLFSPTFKHYSTPDFDLPSVEPTLFDPSNTTSALVSDQADTLWQEAPMTIHRPSLISHEFHHHSHHGAAAGGEEDGISAILSNLASSGNNHNNNMSCSGNTVSSGDSSDYSINTCPTTMKGEFHSSYPNSTTSQQYCSPFSGATHLAQNPELKPCLRPASGGRFGRWGSDELEFSKKPRSGTLRSSHSSNDFQRGDNAFEPGAEAIAQVKEMIYRAAVMRPVNLGAELPAHKPKRKNVRISNDPQTVAARHRRERVSERLRVLQRIVPGGSKMDTATMLDEAANYLKFLKSQVTSLEKVGRKKIGPTSIGGSTPSSFHFPHISPS